MLELTFYKKENNEPDIIEVSEKCYERLAKVGFDKEVEYKNIELLIEDEKYEINATVLNKDNIKILLSLIEKERHKELKEAFQKMDNKPTIKEMRESCQYVKELTEIYESLTLDVYQYFSYDWYKLIVEIMKILA